MDFLGHRVSEQGVEHTPERIEAIKNMTAPQTKTQVRSFLGMLNYFRDSVSMLGPTVVPLSRFAGPKGKGNFKKGEWQHQQAFEAAKAAITGARLLSHLDYSVPIRRRTDACDIGAGAMLYQVVDSQDQFRSCHIAGIDNPVADALSWLHPVQLSAASQCVASSWSQQTGSRCSRREAS
jgi:hypothetical protein